MLVFSLDIKSKKKAYRVFKESMHSAFDESNPPSMEKVLTNNDVDIEKGKEDLQLDKSSKEKQDVLHVKMIKIKRNNKENKLNRIKMRVILKHKLRYALSHDHMV